MFKIESLIVLVVINSCFSKKSSLDITCAFKHSLCNPNLPHPCCDPVDQCQRTPPHNIFRCVENIVLSGLGKSCELDEDCDEIKHAKCSKDGKCICRMETMKVDLWTCAPILGGFCWINDTCAANNSVCIDHECKCRSGYSFQANNQCTRDILGTHCENDDGCNEVNFAKCSKDKVCSCTSNTIPVNQRYCASIFGGFCWETDDCITPNSICLFNKCQCNEEHKLFIYKDECESVCRNKNNYNSTKLDITMSRKICTKKNVCVCLKKYSYEDIYLDTIRDEIDCFADNLCEIGNSKCSDDVCQCKPYCKNESDQALPQIHLNDICSNNNDCNQINHSICSKDKLCVCDENYISMNKTLCRPLYGGFCSKNYECVNINSTCIDNKCLCKPNMVKISKYLCEIPQIGIPCEDNYDCSEILNSICSDDKKCKCQINYGEYNITVCAPFVGEFCFKDGLCAPKHSSCKDDTCVCDDGFLDYSKEKCIPHYVRMHCQENNDCRYVINSECRADMNICTCKEGYGMVNETSCALLLGETCTPNEQCAIENSHCINNTCQCQSGYLNRNENCVLDEQVHLYYNCSNNYDCNRINHSICSNDNLCVCDENYVSINNNLCRPLFGGFCSKNQECVNINSACIDNKCLCKPNMVKISEYLCAIPQIGIPCENNYDCSKILNSMCSDDKKCKCIINYGEYNITACAPFVGEFCFNDGLCAPKHSSCKDDTCVCDDGFLDYSKEKCLPHYVRMHCQENNDCRYVINSECRADINICTCKEGYEMVNDTSCAPLLGETCTPNEQCAIENSHCINNTCQCQPGYHNQNENCVPDDPYLHYSQTSCFEDYNCINIKYAVCSFNQYCTCKSNYIPLGYKRCLGLIGEYCDIDDECYSYNTICLNNECQCSEKFYASNNTHCQPRHLGIKCRKNQDCSVAIKNSICSIENDICVCRKNYYALNKFECFPGLYGNCSENNDCRLNSTICIDNKCKCQDNFSPISDTQCRPNEFFYSCNKVLECGDPWHYTCAGVEKKCRCKHNNFSINRSTCSPGLKGYCWNDRQCTINNSSCIDFHCQCNDKFVGVSNNLCIPGSNRK